MNSGRRRCREYRTTFVNATPSSGAMHLFAKRAYPINRGEIIADLPRLEIQLCVPFFEGLPTVKCSVVGHPTPILRVNFGDGGCFSPVDGLVILRS
jgi:hypothetical protein